MLGSSVNYLEINQDLTGPLTGANQKFYYWVRVSVVQVQLSLQTLAFAWLSTAQAFQI